MGYIYLAKKKEKRLIKTSAVNITDVSQIPIAGGDGLPDYNRYYTCKHFRFFFEAPRSTSERLKDRQNISATNRSFKVIDDGARLVGLEISQTFCRLLIKHLDTVKIKKAEDFNSFFKGLFEYLSSLENKPKLFKDITFQMYAGFIISRPNENQAKFCKYALNALIQYHPLTKAYNIPSISIDRQYKQPIQELDLDTYLDEKEYSDRIMMQMLAYCFYELEVWKKRFELMQNVTKESLKDDYVNVYSVKNLTLKRLLTSGRIGHEKLFLNFLLECKEERRGRILTGDNNHLTKINKISKTSSYKAFGGEQLFLDYKQYLANKMWSYFAKSDKPEVRKYLSFKTQHMPVILALYLMIVTGKNKETILTIKRNYGRKSWYENFDVNLGVDETTPSAQQEIRVVGGKSKGVGGTKSIPIRIPINSPIFEYMKLYDNIINDPDRELFFILGPSIMSSAYGKFCKSFEIIDDESKPLLNINTTRLRKTFAGHLLLQMVENVDSADDLVNKLREALNHQEFDTTLFSYIMKTGMGNQVINTAIVALTSNMLEQAMSFQGEICEDEERKSTNKEVFLCDCTDDSNPSHNIPVADRCKKYDMCLGCERSEVYALHVPRICYRIMQYDEIAAKTPLTFSGLLEDRRQIALDTINKFKNEHGRGIEIVERAYYDATKAMKDRTPLLPPITQLQ